MKRIAVLSAAVLSACAPQSQRPNVDPALAEKERQFQQELAFSDMLETSRRLSEVAFRVSRAAAPMCADKVRDGYGFVTLTVDDLKPELRSAAIRVASLSNELRVLSVLPDGPANKSGLKVGDVVAGVKGTKPLDTKSLREALKGPVNLQIRRGTDTLDLPITPDTVCDFPTTSIDRPEINAFADGKRIVVTTGMLRLARTDEELAVVLGHELAHNARGHLDAKRGNAAAGQVVGTILDVLIAAATRMPSSGAMGNAMAQAGANAYSVDFEREADYVGLYFMARAGYPIDDAPNFWRRMAVANPSGISHATTHPATPERFVALGETIKEIKGKQAKGEALVPNELPKIVPPPAQSNEPKLNL